ncbi:hypothetical protein BOX15_Mlig024679g1 [Macrostomum lignano]|uniref:Peptidase_M13 domain-containing protein n=1 Tax=Macrostomum lignano TaxID=282301 RepID=A0A267H8Y8_9PLAT|nr:hypothetical protein BOX15_Mlig024679g1 [Macrostomum lignano]
MPSPVFSLISLLLLSSSCSFCSASASQLFCTNTDCNSLSANLLLHLNWSANPCDDFYEFACGGFQRQVRYDINDFESEAYTDAPRRMTLEIENRLHEILIDSSLDKPSGERSLRDAVRLTRALYKNCLRWGTARSALPRDPEWQLGTAITDMNMLLEHLLGNSMKLLEMSLEQLLARTAAMGLGTVFDISVSEELGSLGSFNFSSQEYANAPKLTLVVSTFNFTADSSYWSPMLGFLTLNNVSLSEAINNCSALGAETKYVMATVAGEVKAIVESTQNLSKPFNGSLNALELELRSAVPGFNLSLFLHELRPNGVNKSTIVEVDNMPMLKALLNYFSVGKAINNGPDAPTDSTLEMRRVQRHTFLTLDAMLEFVDLLPVLSPALKPSPSSLSLKERISGGQCLEFTVRLMEPALVWLYRQRFHPTKLNVIEKVIETMKVAFVNRMVDQNWITEADKAKMVDKVIDMRYNVGHQELTDEQLASFYRSTSAKLRGSAVQSFGFTLGLAMKANAKRHLDLLTNNPIIKPSMVDIEHTFTVNAYYAIDSNSLWFPLAILTPPIYAAGYPDFAVYGAFGSLVGHEIGHGFAEQWINDASSEQSTFMQLETDTQASYQERVQCMRRELAELKRDSFWNETLAEDIADSMGLSAAYRAYTMARSAETDLLPKGLFDPFNIASLLSCRFDLDGRLSWQRQQLDRLFFVMAAQPYCTKANSQGMAESFRSGSHSSGPVRVNAMMRSSSDFARTFQCPSASRMNPSVKCVFW